MLCLLSQQINIFSTSQVQKGMKRLTSMSLKVKYMAMVTLLYHIMDTPATNPAAIPCNSLSSSLNHRSRQFTDCNESIRAGDRHTAEPQNIGSDHTHTHTHTHTTKQNEPAHCHRKRSEVTKEQICLGPTPSDSGIKLVVHTKTDKPNLITLNA